MVFWLDIGFANTLPLILLFLEGLKLIKVEQWFFYMFCFRSSNKGIIILYERESFQKTSAGDLQLILKLIPLFSKCIQVYFLSFLFYVQSSHY